MRVCAWSYCTFLCSVRLTSLGGLLFLSKGKQRKSGSRARRSGGRGNCSKYNAWEKNKTIKIMSSFTSSMLRFWLVWSYVGFSLKKMRTWENLDKRTLKKPELLRQKRRMRKGSEKTEMFSRVISWQEEVRKWPFMVDYSISPDRLQKHALKKVEHSRHLVCPSKAKHISAIFLGSSSKREASNES